ncbi:MAG: tail fiber domain-containing protein [Chthoniobacterales bacterium]|nr:tail fiber domain-containing protein [Chthoniobacterales bacterium]
MPSAVTTIAGGVAVTITTKGQFGVATSSVRYKDNIQPMAKSSEAVLSLKPVTFRYKKE